MSKGAKIRVSMIVAVAQNGVIGWNGQMPWRLSADLKAFRTRTIGHPIIMGRKTFQSLKKPLDGRDNIVITRASGGGTPTGVPGDVHLAHTLDQALAMAKDYAQERGVEEIFVIGGAQIYSLALPHADRIYLTQVHASPEGDTFFPKLDATVWQQGHELAFERGPKDTATATLVTLERRLQS